MLASSKVMERSAALQGHRSAALRTCAATKKETAPQLGAAPHVDILWLRGRL